MSRSLFLIVFASLFGFLFAQDSDALISKNWQEIKNEELQVAFKLPDGWKPAISKETYELIYFIGDKEDALVTDASAKVLTVESRETAETLESLGKKREEMVKNNEGGKTFIKAFDGKIGNVSTKVIRFSSNVDGALKVSENVIVVYKKRAYSITFTVLSRYDDSNKELKDRIFKTFNFEAMRPSQKLLVTKPEGWFEFTNVDYTFNFSKKNDGGKDLTSGMIQAKTVKATSDKSLQAFVEEMMNSLKSSGKKVNSFSSASIKEQSMLWFDVEDSENLFKERYHVFKIGYSFYVVYFISHTEPFEKDLKPVLAKFLLDIKFGE